MNNLSDLVRLVKGPVYHVILLEYTGIQPVITCGQQASGQSVAEGCLYGPLSSSQDDKPGFSTAAVGDHHSPVASGRQVRHGQLVMPGLHLAIQRCSIGLPTVDHMGDLP